MGSIVQRQRKICIVTGSRADYSHVRPLMEEVKGDKDLCLQIIATGMHLSSEFGQTYHQIEKDGFRVDRKLKILKFGQDTLGVSKAVGLGCQLFAEAFADMKPDIVVILGDRYEMFAATVAAYLARIPIAHVHGGETSQGAFDEGLRHAISKMASFHFAAAEEYRQRIIQLGESPKSVFHFGAPGVDMIQQTEILTKEQLSKKLDMDLNGPTAIVTFHPATLDIGDPRYQVGEMLAALYKSDLTVIFTKANADPAGLLINQEIESFCHKEPLRFKLFDNLGAELYYSCLSHCDVMIGNSSSGLLEAPQFDLPVVNIGDRQKNRARGTNVIDVAPNAEAIERGIRKARSKAFREGLIGVLNPYRIGKGRVSSRIKNKLKQVSLGEKVLKKEFFDIPVPIGDRA